MYLSWSSLKEPDNNDDKMPFPLWHLYLIMPTPSVQLNVDSKVLFSVLNYKRRK